MTEKKLHLLVTAGPSYSPSSHHLLPINTPTPLEIHSPHITAAITIRIQNYRGLPTSSPSTSSYFTSPQHKTDLYSIAFDFTLNEDIPGTDLLFGNDFEKPIRDRLPTGFGTAYRLLRWAIDPGLDGDVYAVGQTTCGRYQKGRTKELIRSAAGTSVFVWAAFEFD